MFQIMRRAYKILVGKSESKRTLWRPMRRCKYNIKIEFKEIRCEDVD